MSSLGSDLDLDRLTFTSSNTSMSLSSESESYSIANDLQIIDASEELVQEINTKIQNIIESIVKPALTNQSLLLELKSMETLPSEAAQMLENMKVRCFVACLIFIGFNSILWKLPYNYLKRTLLISIYPSHAKQNLFFAYCRCYQMGCEFLISNCRRQRQLQPAQQTHLQPRSRIARQLCSSTKLHILIGKCLQRSENVLYK